MIDFRRYYNVDIMDVVEGKISPVLALALYEGLPPGSATWAMQQSEEHWHEYVDAGNAYYALSGIYDAVNVNTRATGNFKKPPKIEPWPVPEIRVKKIEKAKKKPRTVKELYVAMKSRFGSKG